MIIEMKNFKTNGWFLLRIWLLFQLLLVKGFLLEITKDENVVESNNGKEIDINGRMTRMEAKNLKQEREIEVLHTLLEEEKKFSKQLSGRISQLEASAIPCSENNDDQLLHQRPKRPYRLLPPNIPNAKENKKSGEVVPFLGPATNCHELGLLGYTLNGYYLIKKKPNSNTKGKIGVVYCRFQQLYERNEISQELIGEVGVKTKIVHFYVLRSSTFSMKESAIPWQVERLNEGGAMNLTSGIFTIPVNGIYHFEFNGIRDSAADYVAVTLRVNDKHVGSTFDKYSSSADVFDTVSLTASLRLKAKDRVCMYLNKGSIYNDFGYQTQFAGWLVEEDF